MMSMQPRRRPTHLNPPKFRKQGIKYSDTSSRHPARPRFVLAVRLLLDMIRGRRRPFHDSKTHTSYCSNGYISCRICADVAAGRAEKGLDGRYYRIQLPKWIESASLSGCFTT